MAHATNTVYCRGALGTTVNPDTIGCVGTGEFDLNMVRVDAERKSCGFKNIRISVDGARPIDFRETVFSHAFRNRHLFNGTDIRKI